MQKNLLLHLQVFLCNSGLSITICICVQHKQIRFTKQVSFSCDVKTDQAPPGLSTDTCVTKKRNNILTYDFN